MQDSPIPYRSFSAAGTHSFGDQRQTAYAEHGAETAAAVSYWKKKHPNDLKRSTPAKIGG